MTLKKILNILINESFFLVESNLYYLENKLPIKRAYLLNELKTFCKILQSIIVSLLEVKLIH